MKNSVRVMCLCLLAAAVLMSGCGRKYADVKKLNSQFVDSMQEYVADLEKADDAKSVAKAMNRYADRLEKIMPKMKKQAEKHPELKSRKNIPEELKQSQEEAQAMGMKMAGTFMKIAPFMSDPEVMKAQERMGNIMRDQ